MGYPETFEGFCVQSPKTYNEFKKQEIKPKPFTDDDVDIEIECCGVCASDVHTVTGGWGDYTGPLCVGHEVVGKAVRVGKNCQEVKEGDRVGVGAQVWSCLKCDLCKSKNENYCPHLVDTYNSQYQDGSWAHGGFASHIRAHWYFVFRIPDALKSSDVAPLLCAGLTTYSPLVRANIGPGKKVAVLGIGGLGHLGIRWSKALGAETYALTTSPRKADDAKSLGATDVIITTEKDWHKNHPFKFDLILDCTDAADQFDIPAYLSTLNIGGAYHLVGVGDKPLPQLPAGVFGANNAKMTGSHIGNRQEMQGMLKLAAENDLKAVVETIPLGSEGCKQAVDRVLKNDVKFRFTLVDFDKQFKA